MNTSLLTILLVSNVAAVPTLVSFNTAATAGANRYPHGHLAPTTADFNAAGMVEALSEAKLILMDINTLVPSISGGGLTLTFSIPLDSTYPNISLTYTEKGLVDVYLGLCYSDGNFGNPINSQLSQLCSNLDPLTDNKLYWFRYRNVIKIPSLRLVQ